MVFVVIYLEDTILIQYSSAYKIVHFVITARDGYIVFILRTGLTEEIIVPIKVRIIHITSSVIRHNPWPIRVLRLVIPSVQQHLHAFVIIRKPLLVVIRLVIFIYQRHIVITVADKIGRGGVSFPAYTPVIHNGGFSLHILTFLGCDKDNARTGLGSIDGRGRRIFKYGDRLNIVRVDLVEAHFHAICQYKRSTAIDRGHTTYVNGIVGVKGARIESQVHRRIGTLQRTCRCGDRTVANVVSADGRYCAGKIGTLLRSISHYHHLTQSLTVFLKNYLCKFMVRGSQCNGLETDIRYRNLSILGNVCQNIVAIKVRDSPVSRTFDHHGGTDNGVAVGICDLP